MFYYFLFYQVMKSLLSSRGHIVHEAVDGGDFLRAMGYELLCGAQNRHLVYSLQRNELHNSVEDFDIILIDDNMPVIHGSDAVELLRAEGYVGKILGISGDVDVESMERFRRKGVNDVLCKPINIDLLRLKVESLLS
jgi:CheY-like chemotaxis protein